MGGGKREREKRRRRRQKGWRTRFYQWTAHSLDRRALWRAPSCSQNNQRRKRARERERVSPANLSIDRSHSLTVRGDRGAAVTDIIYVYAQTHTHTQTQPGLVMLPCNITLSSLVPTEIKLFRIHLIKPAKRDTLYILANTRLIDMKVLKIRLLTDNRKTETSRSWKGTQVRLFFSSLSPL